MSPFQFNEFKTIFFSRDTIHKAVTGDSHVFSFDEDLVPRALAGDGEDDLGVGGLSLGGGGGEDSKNRRKAETR